jgi:hypothetical protein
VRAITRRKGASSSTMSTRLKAGSITLSRYQGCLQTGQRRVNETAVSLNVGSIPALGIPGPASTRRVGIGSTVLPKTFNAFHQSAEILRQRWPLHTIGLVVI